MKRRGMTILEIVAALAVLGSAAAVISSGVTALTHTSQYQSVRIAAHEAANRVILQHLVSPRSIDTNDPIYVQGIPFVFELDEIVLQGEAPEDGVTRRTAFRLDEDDLSPEDIIKKSLNEVLRQVTVTVWRGDVPRGTLPDARIVRVYDFTADSTRVLDELLRLTARERDNQ